MFALNYWRTACGSRPAIGCRTCQLRSLAVTKQHLTQPPPAWWRQKLTRITEMWTVKVVGLGLVALSLTLELLVWFLRRLRPGRTLNEVLFFPSEMVCVEHIFTPSSPYSCFCSMPHGVETSFSRLLRRILSATSSLDLCVFAFSNMDLCRAVLALHSRRVTIRVLTDKDYTAITGSQIGVLRKAGICVRCDVASVYMHHKFAVVDGRLLITGSLNWTLTAVQSNMENILITEEPELVRPFIKEFDRLWVNNDPARYHRSLDQKPALVIARTND
ncbi:mitochondrial cardiolipin hydrolase isoform X2 [Xiphias gladius]|uniref:mitochondrial cardiolipin hydrolase isoform X2 n=1 Tax=Xiphias gladius TaxID=8245 RepID=UPI001A9927D0|nr:mitochondrial cardiolipin hydrolase isoform X2 [Xiphias gladius]